MPRPPNQSRLCNATATNHCCWVPYVGVCPHFDPGLPAGFCCTLMVELGDWNLVHDDPRYAPQRAAFEAFGTDLCGDYPSRGVTCGECGASG